MIWLMPHRSSVRVTAGRGATSAANVGDTGNGAMTTQITVHAKRMPRVRRNQAPDGSYRTRITRAERQRIVTDERANRAKRVRPRFQLFPREIAVRDRRGKFTLCKPVSRFCLLT